MKFSHNLASQLESDSFDQQVTALREIARSSNVQGSTIRAVELAGSADDEVRMWAAEALESSIQPTSHEASGLIERLQHSADGEVCYWTATMLGRLGSEISTMPETAESAVSALASCLSDSLYLPARERAAWALRQLGPVSKLALPTLRQVAMKAPPRLQRLTNETLKALDAAA